MADQVDKQAAAVAGETVASVTAKAVSTTTVPFKSLFRFASTGDAVLLSISLVCAVASGICMPLFSIIFGDLLDALNNPLNFQVAVYDLCAKLGALALGMGLAQYAMVGLSSYGAARQVSRLRTAYFDALLRQDAGWHDQGRASEAATRLAADTVALEGAVGQRLCVVVQSYTTFVAGIIIGFVQGWKMALVILGFIPLFILLGAVAHKHLGDAGKQGQDFYARAGAIATETLATIRTVASFSGERAEAERYDKALAQAERAGRKAAFGAAASIGALFAVMFSCYAVGLYWGGRLVLLSREADPLCTFDVLRPGCFTGGDVLNVIFALLMGGGGMGQAGPALQVIAQAQGAAHGIFSVVDRKPAIDTSAPGGVKPHRGTLKGRIEFKNVSFSYPSRPDEPVLRDFSLVIEAGETLALVGGSGSGKSTIIALIQRQYDPQGGVVTLDGVDLREYNVQALRACQAIVSQEPQLFATTVRENIALGLVGTGAPASAGTDDVIHAAARSANAHDFISRLPDGYDTHVTGAQLSGGQKQRVAIARAIVRSPQILLLDEATSALDTTAERLVQRDLDRLLEESKRPGASAGRTAIMVAHRLSTVVRADRIIVLNRGCIAESGSHAQLMAMQDSTYRKLRELQRVQDDEVDVDVDRVLQAQDTAAAALTAAAEREAALDAPVKVAASSRPAAPVKDAVEEAKEKEKADMESAMKLPPVPFSRLLYVVRAEWVILGVGVLGSGVMGAVFPVMSILLSRFMATFYEPDNAVLLDKVTMLMVYFFIVAGVAFSAALMQTWSFGYVKEALLRRLRLDLFRAVIRQPVGWHDLPVNSAGRLTSRLASDTALLGMAVGTNMALHIQNVIQLLIGMGIAFWASWRMTLVILAISPLLGLGGYLQMKFALGLETAAQKELAQCADIATEAMTNSRTVAAFCLQDTTSERFIIALRKPTEAAKKGSMVAGIGAGFMNTMMIAIYALAFYVGSIFIQNGWMTFQELMQAFFAVVFAAMGIGQASGIGADAAKIEAAKRSIYATIDTQSPIDPFDGDGGGGGGGGASGGTPGKGSAGTALVIRTPGDGQGGDAGSTPAPPPPSGDLVFRDVHFTYPARADQQVLRGLSLTIPLGKVVAIVGPSGSGKSTIVQLLQRFYDPDSGTITMGGVDIKSLPVHALRGCYGWVQQEAPLFADSVAYNIAFGVAGPVKLPAEAGVLPDAGPSATAPAAFTLPPAVVSAAKASNAHSFIEGFKHGYATFAGERGNQLSGGQKQRVAIARAIVRAPRVLLLDEATSALDSESEAVVQQSIDALLDRQAQEGVGGALRPTTIVIAHRLSTVKRADEIVVVDRGVVVERGTHDQLMVVPGGDGAAAGPGAGCLSPAPLGPVGVYRRMVLEQDAGMGAAGGGPRA